MSRRAFRDPRDDSREARALGIGFGATETATEVERLRAEVVEAAAAFVGHYLNSNHGGGGAYADWVRLKAAVVALEGADQTRGAGT